MRRIALMLLVTMTAACAAILPAGVVHVSTRPIPHVGVNLGPERFTPANLDRLAALQRPLTLRTTVTSAAQAIAVLTACQPYPGLSVLLLVEHADLGLVASLLTVKDAPTLAGIELGNELDLAGLSAAQFGAFVTAGDQQLRSGGYRGPILSGGVYTVDADTVAYVQAAQLPPDVCVGWHLYQTWSDPVLAAMQAVSPCLAVTETGMPSRTPTEDAGQLAYLQDSKAAARRAGAAWWIVYQLVSGPTASNLDNFGLWHIDGSAKPGFGILSAP